MAAGFFQTIRDRAFGLLPQNQHSERSKRAQGADRTAARATGIIRIIRHGKFGFIARDTASERTDLFFHRSAVEADGFNQLREGQAVSFDEESDSRDPNRQRAINVAPIASEDPTEIAAHGPNDSSSPLGGV